MGLKAYIVEFFASLYVLFLGLSFLLAFSALLFLFHIQPDNYIDLQSLVGNFGIEDVSLQKIYAILFQKKISKGQRLTNWEAEALTDSQKKYAALDAWACLQIYKELNNQ